jgi:hypothetical protein
VHNGQKTIPISGFKHFYYKKKGAVVSNFCLI